MILFPVINVTFEKSLKSILNLRLYLHELLIIFYIFLKLSLQVISDRIIMPVPFVGLEPGLHYLVDNMNVDLIVWVVLHEHRFQTIVRIKPVLFRQFSKHPFMDFLELTTIFHQVCQPRLDVWILLKIVTKHYQIHSR